jgi:hypothetical protein
MNTLAAPAWHTKSLNNKKLLEAGDVIQGTGASERRWEEKDRYMRGGKGNYERRNSDRKGNCGARRRLQDEKRARQNRKRGERDSYVSMLMKKGLNKKCESVLNTENKPTFE